MKFLEHDIVKKWDGENNSGMVQISECLNDIMAPKCTVLLIGTGATIEQYDDWPQVLQSVWGCSITYLEIFESYIELFKDQKYPIIKGDVREIDKILEKSYDVILWLQGPEHVSHEELLPTLDALFSVCNNGIMCTCPWGSFYDYQEDINNNKYEIHIQKSMDAASFGKEFKNYTIQYGGIFNTGNGQILIKRKKQ